MRISFHSSQQLRNLVSSLLATSAPIHAAGFVHRDIDNIDKGPKGSVLLAWELAGRQDQPVW